jgi:hypothetical protein
MGSGRYRRPRDDRRRDGSCPRPEGHRRCGRRLRGCGVPVRLPPRSLADNVKGSLRSALTGRPLTPPALFENGATERRRQATNRGGGIDGGSIVMETKGTDAEAWPQACSLANSRAYSAFFSSPADPGSARFVAAPSRIRSRAKTEAKYSNPRARTRAGGPIRGPKPEQNRTSCARARERTWTPRGLDSAATLYSAPMKNAPKRATPRARCIGAKRQQNATSCARTHARDAGDKWRTDTGRGVRFGGATAGAITGQKVDNYWTESRQLLDKVADSFPGFLGGPTRAHPRGPSGCGRDDTDKCGQPRAHPRDASRAKTGAEPRRGDRAFPKSGAPTPGKRTSDRAGVRFPPAPVVDRHRIATSGARRFPRSQDRNRRNRNRNPVRR